MTQKQLNQKSNAYWKKREADERKWIDSNIKSDADYDRIIQKHYDKLLKNINNDINDQYMRYAGREGMSIVDARKAVSRHDVQAFSNEAKDAVARARELFKKKGSVAYTDFDAELNQRLRLYNATMRINRLEYLKANLGLELMNTNIDIGTELAQRLQDGYSAEARRQAGILGETMGKTNIGNVSKIVMAQTKNANFSDRLWANSDVLKTKLDGILTQQYVQGLNPRVIATKLRPMLADNVKNARYVTERLARTESARVATQAQLDSFKQYDINVVKWHAEPSACKICASIASTNDGVYPLKDVPYLPAHANCRCSISAWYDDGTVKSNNNAKDDIKQAMNDIDMSTATSQDLINLGKMVNEKHNIDKLVGDREGLKAVFGKYREMGGTVSPKAWYGRSNKDVKTQIQHVFDHYPKQWSKYFAESNKKLFAGSSNRGFFTKNLVTSRYKLISGAKDGEGYSIYGNRYSVGTAFHEVGHMVDALNPNTIRIEREWIANRTKGESLVKLRDLFPGAKYSADEVVKKDNFIAPYIGKQYKHDATEVLSMRLENLFIPGNGVRNSISNGQVVYKKITDDPEYLNLIIGLILKG